MGEFMRVYKSDITDRQFSAFWNRAQECGRARAIGFDGPPMSGQDFCRWMRRDDMHPWLVLFRGEVMGLYYLTNWQGRAAHVHFLTLPCGTKRTAGRLPVAVAAGLFSLGSSLWEHESAGAMAVPSCGVGAELGGVGQELGGAGDVGQEGRGSCVAGQDGGGASDAASPKGAGKGESLPRGGAPSDGRLATSDSTFLLDTLIGVTPADNREAVRFVQRLGAIPCAVVPSLCWRFDGNVNVAGFMTVFNRDAVPAWTAKL